MNNLAGIVFPNHGEPIFKEDWVKEQSEKSKEIINRDLDINGAGVQSGGAVTDGGTNTVDLAATVAYDADGKRIEVPATTGIAVANGTFKLAIRHVFENTDFFAPENAIKAVVHRDNDYEIVLRSGDLEDGDIALAEVVSDGSGITSITDLREYRTVVDHENRLVEAESSIDDHEARVTQLESDTATHAENDLSNVTPSVGRAALDVIGRPWLVGGSYSLGDAVFHPNFGWLRAIDAVASAAEADLVNSVHKFKPVGAPVGFQGYGEVELFGYLFMDARDLGGAGSGATLQHDKYLALRDHLFSRIRVGLGALTVLSVTNNGGGKCRLTFSGTPSLAAVQVETANFPSPELPLVTLPADSARVNFGSGAANYKIIGVNTGSYYVDIDLDFASQSVTGTAGIYPYRLPGSETRARLPESRHFFARSGGDGWQKDAFMRHRHGSINGTILVTPGATGIAGTSGVTTQVGSVGDPTTDGASGTTRDDLETRGMAFHTLMQIKY